VPAATRIPLHCHPGSEYFVPSPEIEREPCDSNINDAGTGLGRFQSIARFEIAPKLD